jgi:hypothetical protein
MNPRRCLDPDEGAFSTTQALTRRSIVGSALLGSFFHSRSRGAAKQGSEPQADQWFWDLIAETTAGPKAGGPHSGTILHSRYGVEIHRAGRRNPDGVTPSLSNFYLEAEFHPEPQHDRWEIGIAWRVSEQHDALWWTITNSGSWTMYQGVWRMVLDQRSVLRTGDVSAVSEPVLKLQAIVAGPLFACSINQQEVIRTPLAPREAPGHVAIVANCSQEFLLPDGGTRYTGLSVWSLDPNS